MFGDSKRAVGLWWWRGDTGAFQEINAKGFGNFTPQDAGSQGLQGTVTWADGRYTMVVKRTLTTAQHKLDMQFESGAFVPMSFHVWDGDRGELGSRGALTNWRWLYLEPAVPRGKLLARAGAVGIAMLALLGVVVVRTRR